jgi:hypothetical protein
MHCNTANSVLIKNEGMHVIEKIGIMIFDE